LSTTFGGYFEGVIRVVGGVDFRGRVWNLDGKERFKLEKFNKK